MAGRELGVDSVLEGNLQIAGDRMRVTVQLMNVKSGGASWAGTFEEKLTDVFALQESIAEKVSSAVKGQITAAERKKIYRRYTSNVAAYQLYMRGRSRLPPYNKDDALAAISDFEGALLWIRTMLWLTQGWRWLVPRCVHGSQNPPKFDVGRTVLNRKQNELLNSMRIWSGRAQKAAL